MRKKQKEFLNRLIEIQNRKRGMVYLMKGKIFSSGSVVLLVLLASAWAADVTGKWIARSSSEQGDFEITLVFKVDGTKVTGTLDNSQMPGEVAINEGKLNGDELSFFIVRKMGETEMKVGWKGKIAGDEIRFTREIQGGMMGGPGGGVGAPAAQEIIVAKRAK
jgi:hypothetical protein